MQVAKSAKDAFSGLLHENRQPGIRAFGPTMTQVLLEQFHRIFFGPGGSWWETHSDLKDAVRGFEHEIADATLAAVINDNTGAYVAGDGFLSDRASDTSSEDTGKVRNKAGDVEPCGPHSPTSSGTDKPGYSSKAGGSAVAGGDDDGKEDRALDNSKSGQKGFNTWRKRDARPEGWLSPRSSKGGLHFKYVSRGQAEQALRKFEAVKQRSQQRHSAGNEDDSYRGNGGSARSRLDHGKYRG